MLRSDSNRLPVSSANVRTVQPATEPTALPPVVILGMHRSGTSWLAGGLQASGLHLGNVSERNTHNKLGNREDRALVQLHDSVLRANGGSWDRPRYPNSWTQDQRTRLSRLVSSMSSACQPWGFKDPRTLLVLDEWKRHLWDSGICFGGIYRHPMAVCASLRNRTSQLSQRRAPELWRVYNERLISEHAEAPFPLLRFDVDRDRLRGSSGIYVFSTTSAIQTTRSLIRT